MRTPDEIAAELAPAYDEWKGGEKAKEKLKGEFFTAITEVCASGDLEEGYLLITAATEPEAVEAAERQRPEMNIEEFRKSEDIEDAWEFILVENPEYMAYSVEINGRVWKRGVTEGDSMLDNEAIEQKDPELWKRVTFFKEWKLVESVAYEAGMDPRQRDMEYAEEGGFDGYLERHLMEHGYKRELKDADEIADEDLAALQEYTYYGKPKIKLPAPTKVKEAKVG